MKHALYLPPFGELADPRVLVDLAVAAEGAGWDGLFVWDHMWRPEPAPREIADPWVALAGIAATTSSLVIGPMVTPLVRRRPQKVARETITLDQLSDGRVVLGLGLGVDHGGELTNFAEMTDAKARGDLMDEGAALLAAMLSGEPVDHRGNYFTAENVQFLPRPVQQPRVPIWCAARKGAPRPTRRAARYDGLFPIEIDEDGLSRSMELVVAERGSLDGFDVAVVAIPGMDLDGYEARGATWAMWSFMPGESAAEVGVCVEAGPGNFG